MRGTIYDYRRDGITQGLLTLWLECRMKAFYFLQGYTPKGVPLALTYGTIGHAMLEKAYEAYRLKRIQSVPDNTFIVRAAKEVEKSWLQENSRPSKGMLEDLEFSLLCAERVLPIYFQHWASDFKKIEWLKVESAFKIPYTTKDGRKTFIRGRIDGAFRRNGLWLLESKFKSVINEIDLLDTLAIDTQIMVYLWAMVNGYKFDPSGVVYNVTRRPGLKRRVGEGLEQFGKRIEADVKKRPEWYFYRFEVSMGKADVVTWNKLFEALIVEFMDWCDGKRATYLNTNSCVTKYGRCWGLTACASQQFYGLQKRKTVFRELEDV